LLLFGLRAADASSVALWLNFELAATALLGVALFREHLGVLGWSGVVAALAGASVLSLPHGTAGVLAGGFVLLACLCWGFDNHLTALIDGLTPSQSTFWKGLVAGTTNLTIGTLATPLELSPATIGAALVVGALAYGASIALYISAAQSLGATRAQIVFATAPFFGVLLAVLVLGDAFGWEHALAGALFVLGIVLFMFERHSHLHRHEPMEHEHEHRHDDGHHDHEHPGLPSSTRHSHVHRHEAQEHAHPHLPDLHHRHGH
jgi:drug/metabolite transporter (DMT)-like permease